MNYIDEIPLKNWFIFFILGLNIIAGLAAVQRYYEKDNKTLTGQLKDDVNRNIYFNIVSYFNDRNEKSGRVTVEKLYREAYLSKVNYEKIRDLSKCDDLDGVVLVFDREQLSLDVNIKTEVCGNELG